PARGTGQLVLPHTVVQHDYGVHRDGALERVRAGTTPLAQTAATRFSFDGPLCEALSARLDVPLSEACLASGDVFIDDAPRASQVREAVHAELLDMEAGAIAQVC